MAVIFKVQVNGGQASIGKVHKNKQLHQKFTMVRGGLSSTCGWRSRRVVDKQLSSDYTPATSHPHHTNTSRYLLPLLVTVHAELK